MIFVETWSEHDKKKRWEMEDGRRLSCGEAYYKAEDGVARNRSLTYALSLDL